MATGQLEDEVKRALKKAVGDVLSGEANVESAWPELADNLKGRAYKEIVDILLGSHHPAVAAAVLKALEDDRIGPEELGGFLVDWANERVGENAIVNGLIEDFQADGALTPREAFTRLVEWAKTRTDDSTIQALIEKVKDGTLSAEERNELLVQWAKTRTGDPTILKLLDDLQDGALSKQKTLALLVGWVQSRVGDVPIVTDLLNKLKENGTITTDDVVAVLVVWAKRQVNNDTISALLDGLSAGGFDARAARTALLDYVRKVVKSDQLGDDLEAAIDAKFSTQSVLLLLSVWAAASGESTLAALLSDARTNKPEQVIISWLNSRAPKEAQELLGKILAEDWYGFIAAVLGLLDMDMGVKLVKALAQKQVLDLVTKQLTEYLKKQGVAHAGDVAAAIIALATGAADLFALAEESDASDILDTFIEIAVWREIRHTIYITQLFIKGGMVVPDDPMAQPHVFQAAGIRYTTPIKDAVANSDDIDKRNEFCKTLTAVVDTHFQNLALGSIKVKLKQTFTEKDSQVLFAADIVSPNTSLPPNECSLVFSTVFPELTRVQL